MRGIGSLHRLMRLIVGTLLGSLVFAATAIAADRSWNLANDFPLVNQNPAFDKYGHRVWTYMYGTTNTPSTFKRFTKYFGPEAIEAACNIKNIYMYNKLANPNGTPAIFYNAGETIPAGEENHCDHSVTLPGKTVFMHPQANGDLAASVRWKSTVKGTVTVSGSVECVDEFVTGISWQLDKNSTVILGPTEVHDNAQHTFGPVSVPVTKEKEFLYFEIKHAAGASGTGDTTAVTLTITSPS